MHEKYRANHTLCLELPGQSIEIALHHRLDVSIGHHRIKSLVLPHLGRDLGGKRHGNTRQFFSKNLPDHGFMVAIDIRVHKAHRYAFISFWWQSWSTTVSTSCRCNGTSNSPWALTRSFTV